MAQVIDYNDSDVVFEAPFVACRLPPSPFSDRYRVEVQFVGRGPTLPDSSIYLLCCAQGKNLYDSSLESVSSIVDWLNEQARKGTITLQGSTWVSTTYSEPLLKCPKCGL